MVAKKNLIGMKFGTLTVIQNVGSNKEGRVLWLCHCDCGEERVAIGKDLGKKITRCPKKCILTEDLTGKQFGNLLVLNQEGSDKHGFRQFRCKCMTSLNAIKNDREIDKSLFQDGICGAELLINAVGLKRSLKNLENRQLPKCCLRCSRILGGKARRERHPIEDLSGQVFGRLTAVQRLFRGNGTYKRPMYECTCSCGSGLVSYVRQEALIGKSVIPIRSCGCLRTEALRENKTNLIHGLSNHPLYHVRGNMIRRCYDKTCKAYSRYGGRGIEICSTWLEDFMIFYSWAIEHGWTAGLTIDRIDNDGPYSSKNCQILTRSANALKMHHAYGKAFLIEDKQININELSINSSVSAELCKKLLTNGYSIEDVAAYGKLKLHQKNAVSRSIHAGQQISIASASTKERVTKIKQSQPSELGSYHAMMARCYNPNDSSYRNYGAKGIKVCPEWKNNSTRFLTDLGPKPEPKANYVLDRIDPSKDYFLGNCRWLSRSENSRRVKRK